MSFEMPEAPFFDAFGEDAIWHKAGGDEAIRVIPEFDIDIETAEGIEFSTGTVGIFDISKDVYSTMKSGRNGDKFSYQGTVYTVIQKKPINGGTYQIVAEG